MKKRIFPVVFMLATVLVIFSTGSMAAATTPGSQSDPLVSKSYVDDKINQLMNSMASGSANSSAGTFSDFEDLMGDVIARLEFLYGDRLFGGDTQNSPGEAYSVQSAYLPVSAVAGQVILGGEGTEIILRSGKADGFCPGLNGLINVTDGSEINNGNPLGINNLIIVPRDDGRGVIIMEDAWFIIKGSYRILN